MFPRRIRSARTLGLLLGAAAVAALGACDGENLFDPSSRGPLGATRPPDVEIVQPRQAAALPLGDSLLVQALVRDSDGIDSVRFEGVALRGSAELGTDTVVVRFLPKTVVFPAAARDTLVARYLLAVPDSVRETVVVSVTAWDRGGNATTATTNLTLGGPEVRFLNIQQGGNVVAGLSRNLRVSVRDPVGVTRLDIAVRGAFTQDLVRTFTPATDSAVVDTTLVIPSGLTGEITVEARALNTEGNPGSDGPITLRIVPVGQADQVAPRLQVRVQAPERLETSDSILVELTGSDDTQGSGVVRVGYTVLAISNVRGDTLVRSEERTFQPARTGTLTQRFHFAPFNVDSLSLPDTLIYEVTGYMVDQAGNCGAAIQADSLQSLPCGTVMGQTVAANRQGLRATRTVVAGRTVRIPQGGLILDAAVDTVRRNLLLSNQNRNQIEVFRLQEERFTTPLGAGSRPWGISMNRTGDTLLVANSGGTDVSRIFLGDGNGVGAREDNAGRILTPDVTLWDIEETQEAGGTVYEITYLPAVGATGFSDRPQFIAQDSTGRLLYSTVTNVGAERGTVRKAFTPPGGRTEVVILFEHARFTKADEFYAVANADDFFVTYREEFGPPGEDGEPGEPFLVAEVTMTDHVPGFPDQVFSGSGQPPNALIQSAVRLRDQGSDVYVAPGFRWNMAEVGFEDTTFVAASGDGGWVVIGEGARDPLGRIIMYNATQDRVSGVVEVGDILTNAGERVAGIGLNNDGTLGVARGFDAYFFNPDLRLRGLAELPQGGAGAALHPLHANFPALTNPGGTYRPDTHLAFLGTGQRTIDIVDTFRFRRLGRLFIRDVVSGPLRAVLPFPEDNQGFQCLTSPVTNSSGQFIGNTVRIFQDADGLVPYPPNGLTEDRCVVLKLFAITDSGGVVVVDVRKSDILREHPARQ